MALKTEELKRDIYEKIISNQQSANEAISLLGQIHLKIKELKDGIKQLESEQLSNESKFIQSDKTLTEIIRSLELKYPNGEIDLKTGTVTYDSDQQ